MVKAPRSQRETGAGKKSGRGKERGRCRLGSFEEKYQQHKYKEGFEGNSELLREHLSSLLANQVEQVFLCMD